MVRMRVSISQNACKSHLPHSTTCLRCWRAAQRQNLFLPRLEKRRGPSWLWCVDSPVGPVHQQKWFLGDRALASCLAGGDLDGYVACALRTTIIYMALQGYIRHLLSESSA